MSEIPDALAGAFPMDLVSGDGEVNGLPVTASRGRLCGFAQAAIDRDR
ncbi:hypothetical protein P3102_25200 [Amycolatopsis sp. QT-25]|nr:hypothetical protein [Amycolatopsis sp. QT-25]WET77368.1 hypothetical protein P3102_25200 [Amycolatopsis sp. QT-25]